MANIAKNVTNDATAARANGSPGSAAKGAMISTADAATTGTATVPLSLSESMYARSSSEPTIVETAPQAHTSRTDSVLRIAPDAPMTAQWMSGTSRLRTSQTDAWTITTAGTATHSRTRTSMARRRPDRS